MIYAGELGEKADFPRILEVISAEERAGRLLSVGLKINEATESCEPIDNLTIPTITLIEAVIMESHAVVQDLPVVQETVLETNESTPSVPMIRNIILDQLVENITSDLMLEDVKGTTNLAGSEPVKLVEKKRKARDTDFKPAHFKVKTKISTRFSGFRSSLTRSFRRIK